MFPRTPQRWPRHLCSCPFSGTCKCSKGSFKEILIVSINETTCIYNNICNVKYDSIALAHTGAQQVCYLEEAVDVLPGRAVLHAGVGVLPHHVVDGVHDVRHLLGRPKREKKKRKHHGCHVNTTRLSRDYERERENDSGTSLVMQPSLLRSYRLKAQFSLSVMEPLKMMDRFIMKSCSPT